MNKWIVLLLVALLAGCTHREADPPTALMQAAARGDLAQARALLAAGADVNERRGVHRALGMVVEGDHPIAGETALLFAIQSDHVDVAATLLAAGARLDVRDSWGRSVWFYLRLAIGRDRGTHMTRLILSEKRLPAVDEYFLEARGAARDAANFEAASRLSDYLAAHQPGPCLARPGERQALCGRQI